MGSGRHLTYDRRGRVLADQNGDVLVEYIWASDVLVAVVSTVPSAGSIAHGIATDHLGAPWRAWDLSTSDLSWSVSYQPFGRVEPIDGATAYSPTPSISLRRPGQLSNPYSATYQNWHRDFDPAAGSYMQVDPLQRRGSLLPTYLYAQQNPLAATDPTGLYFVVNDAAVMAALLDVASNYDLLPYVQALEADPLPLNIELSGLPRTGYDPVSNSVTLNPAKLLMPESDIASRLGVQLAHELGHAYDRQIYDEDRMEETATEFENYFRMPGPYRDGDIASQVCAE